MFIPWWMNSNKWHFNAITTYETNIDSLSGIHPFQIEDEDQMLDNIEDGIWRWLGPNWDSISEEGKDLIKHMMDPDPKTRWTIDQCLESKWIVRIYYDFYLLLTRTF